MTLPCPYSDTNPYNYLQKIYLPSDIISIVSSLVSIVVCKTPKMWLEKENRRESVVTVERTEIEMCPGLSRTDYNYKTL